MARQPNQSYLLNRFPYSNTATTAPMSHLTRVLSRITHIAVFFWCSHFPFGTPFPSSHVFLLNIHTKSTISISSTPKTHRKATNSSIIIHNAGYLAKLEVKFSKIIYLKENSTDKNRDEFTGLEQNLGRIVEVHDRHVRQTDRTHCTQRDYRILAQRHSTDRNVIYRF